MSNVLFSLRTATTDTLGTVSSVAKTVSHSADGLANLAATGAAHSASYRRITEKDLADKEQSLMNKRRHQSAIDDAQFFKSTDELLKADPVLKGYYDKALASYATSDEA